MKIYIVEGSSGEYSAHQEWPVAAYFSEAKAAQRVIDCQRAGNEIIVRFPDYRYGADFRSACQMNAIDPQIQIDYTGVNYSFYGVEIADEAGS